MYILTTIDTIWLNVALPASSSSNWTSQISYDVAASVLRILFVRRGSTSSTVFTSTSLVRLEAADADHDDDGDERYDMVLCVAAGQPKLDLSDQLRRCRVASTKAILLRVELMFLCYLTLLLQNFICVSRLLISTRYI